MNKIIKIITFITSIFLILQICFAENKSKAASIGDVNYLERAEKGFYSIQRWNGSKWIYVTYSITNYVDGDGIKRVAYCVNPDLKGIGHISGEFEGYNVELKSIISNEKCWRVLKNGYPYKTPEQLGVETEQDAYLATKMALYAMLRGNTENEIKELYRAGQDPVAGQNKEDIYRRGNKVVHAICTLVDIGNNGSETMKYNNILKIEKEGKFEEDEKDKAYYSQTIKVISEVECSEFFIKNIDNFPQGTKIVNLAGEDKTTFKGGDDFKVMIPKTSLIEDINGTIEISGTCENYPIYYAECMNGNYQNYYMCCDSFSKNISAVGNIAIKIEKSELKINKIDSDTSNPIEGVKFSIKYKDGTNIGIYTTDKNGEISVTDLHQGEIVIKELETKEEYELDSKENIVTLGYNKVETLTIKNEIKKANIKLIKVDADNKEIKIEGAKFEIYNELGELVKTVVTDENGEVYIEKLPINHKYTVKEVETAKDYILSEDTITVELQENEIKNITFENKKKVEEKIVEKLPRTGSTNMNIYFLGISMLGVLLKKLM